MLGITQKVSEYRHKLNLFQWCSILWWTFDKNYHFSWDLFNTRYRSRLSLQHRKIHIAIYNINQKRRSRFYVSISGGRENCQLSVTITKKCLTRTFLSKVRYLVLYHSRKYSNYDSFSPATTQRKRVATFNKQWKNEGKNHTITTKNTMNSIINLINLQN